MKSVRLKDILFSLCINQNISPTDVFIGDHMSTLSVFHRARRPTAYIKVVNVLNGQMPPEQIYQILEEGALLEAVQIYADGFRYQQSIGFDGWANRLRSRLENVSWSEPENAAIFNELMEVFSAMDEHQYTTTDYDFFYATWDLPEFKQYAQSVFKKDSNGSAQAQEVVSKLIEVLGKHFGNTAANPNTDFLQQWNKIEDVGRHLGADVHQAVKRLSSNNFFVCSPEMVVNLFEYYQWDPEALSSNILDGVFRRGNQENIKKIVEGLPEEFFTRNNGSLLYRVLRSTNLLNDSVEEVPMAGVPQLLKRIDYLKCLKERFYEVSPAERLQVTANLVPFLSGDEQEKVFELLEDSLSRTKSKKELKEFNDSTTPKAQEFKQLWADNNVRKKMKKEMTDIPQQTSSRKI